MPRQAARSIPRKLLGFSLAGVAVLSILACGEVSEQTEPKPSAPPFLPLVDSPQKPQLLDNYDESCQRQTGPEAWTLESLSSYIWSGSSTVLSLAPLHSHISSTSDGLKSDAVLSTKSGQVFERQCDYRRGRLLRCPGPSGNELSWTMKSAGSPVKLCQPLPPTARDSLEGVALSALRGLDLSHAAYRRADLQQYPLKGVQLSVLPEFVDIHEYYPYGNSVARLRTWITHNMAYFPDIAMIAAFPESAALAGDDPGKLWESPFVLAHEYGHHIEMTRLGSSFAGALGLMWDPISHGFAREGLAGSTSDQQASKVLGALSEGFADLLAYYALRGDTTSLVGLPCLGQNRDVSRPVFADGAEKSLTNTRLAILIGESEDLATGCGIPRYSDIHVVGAILATALDQVFAMVGNAAEDVDLNTDRWTYRYSLSLAWHKNMHARTAALADGSADAPRLLREVNLALGDALAGELARLEAADSGLAAALKQKICRSMQRALPVAAAPYQQQNGSC